MTKQCLTKQELMERLGGVLTSRKKRNPRIFATEESIAVSQI